MDDNMLERQILERTIDLLNLTGVEAEKFDFDAPIFLADEEDVPGLGLDSMDGLELVLMVEEEFGVEIPVEDMEGLRTIRVVADYVREHGGSC